MSDTTPSEDVARAVEYLEESDDPIDSKISVIRNATETGEFTVNDVLSEYVRSISATGAVYPMHESRLRELYTGIEKEVGEGTLQPLPEICQPQKLIKTRDDVITQCINIYTSDDGSGSEKQDEIKTLVQDAQRAGIDVTSKHVVRALKDFESTASEGNTGTVDVDMESVTLATDVTVPNEVQAKEEYVYQVSLADDVVVTNIDWYIGGTHAGSGETVLHTFEYAGVYTVSVELTDSDGNTDYINKEITVTEPSTIDVAIDGETVIDAEESVKYTADITSENETVQEITWSIDGEEHGSGKVLNTSFEQDGEHSVSVTAVGESGLTVTETEAIEVNTPTSILVHVDAPDTAYTGESVTIDCEISVENSYIDSTTCKVGDSVVDIGESSIISFEYEFTEVGEYPVTVTATNNAGDTDTGAETILVHVRPDVSITAAAEEVVRGDGETFKAKFDDRLSSSWGVNNASLTHVGSRTAQVNFNSGIEDEATITVEVENGAGETASESTTVTVHEPRVDGVMTAPDTVTVGENAQFSVEDTTVEYADIDRVEWSLSDGMVIGHGETLTYAFSAPGTETVSATIYTNRDVGDTVSKELTINPETDVTAVIIDRGGPTTRDTFTLDAGKSDGKNTEITSYTWDIDEQEELTGEVIDVEFDSPGSYNAQLTVEAESGDVDTDRATLSVEQFTDVSAKVSGPDSVRVGEQAKFTARESDPVNTSITEYTWWLNDTPAGSGDVFTQTFEKPGHYTVKVEAKTATGDSDTATASVVVNTPEAVIEPVLTCDPDPPFTVGDTVTLSVADSSVENGEMTGVEWKIGGESLTNTGEVIETVFSEFGETTIEAVIIEAGGVRESCSTEVYVSPAVSDPPYEELSDGDGVAEVYTAVVTLYNTDALTVSDKNRFAAHLICDAHDNDIEVTVSDVTEYLSDIDAIDDGNISIDLGSVEDERDLRYSSVDTGVDDEDTGVWDIGSGDAETVEEDDGIELSDDVELDIDDPVEDDGDEDDSSDENEDDEQSLAEETVDDGVWETNDGDSDALEEDTKQEFESEDQITLSDEKTESEDDTVDEDELPSVDSDKIDERHTEDRISPETFDLGDSIFAMPNYAQDLVDFEYIMDEGDEMIPEGVNGAGIIAAEDDQYIAIARVTGRDWSIHTMQKKRDIVKSYESQFLSGLDNPIQIVSIPTRFDLREHIKMVNAVLEEKEDDPDELLMNIGRTIYPNWLENFMIQNDMKERQFYIVVPLSAEQLHRFKGGSDNITEKLAEIPGIGGVFDRFVDEKAEDISKYQCLRELNTRMKRIQSSLRRIEVSVERIENRNEAMAVLYHYYHNKESDQDVFPTGPFTTGEEDPTVAGVSVSHLIGEHDPAHDGADEDKGDSQ